MSWNCTGWIGGNPTPLSECLINGERKVYHACSRKSLPEAVAYYEPLGYKHIGSGHTYYINGTENKSDSIVHFFVKY